MKFEAILSSRCYRSILAGAVIAFLLPALAVAQRSNDGSVYTRFGLGDRQTWNSARGQAMGGGGYALPSTLYINMANPASLSDQILTRFAGGLTYQTLTTSSDGFESGRLASGSLSGVHAAFPIKINKTGIGLSLAPYTRISYRIQDLNTIAGEMEDTGVIREYSGNGGLYALTGGIGHRLSDNLSLGVSAQMIFGLLEEAQSSRFNNSLYTDRTVEKSTRLRGATASLGARYVVPGLPRGKGLVFGATLTLPTTLSGERIAALTTSVGTDTLGTTTKGDASIPVTIGAGVAFQPGEKWSLVADLLYEGWSSFSSDFDFPGYDHTANADLNNRVRISAGVEFWPAGNRPFASYGAKIAYRAGLYSDRSYTSPDPDQIIRALGVTGGLSLPSLLPGTTIDLNVDVGRRGSTSNGLVHDRYIRFGLNINFGERWFDRLPLG
ncbi:MAG: hypothetical protein O2797_02205 [Bacteroidetes bacterium]|nr:hypothetical protein [Bacteroidota bacterium]MDA1333013.1 hypothetical protein [Bacteroidota bacterium]